MTSLLCVKQPGGSLRIHDSETVTQHLGPVEPQPAAARRKYSTSSAHKGLERKSDKVSSLSSSRARNIKDWLNAKSVKELQDRADKETRSTRKLLTNLLDGEKTFVKEADNYIEKKEMLELRKRELLHKNWSDNVYEPLREKINSVMEGHDWKEVDRRKRELHKQYLEFSNKKGHVFLNTIDAEEYYPMALHSHRPAPLWIDTSRLRDPLLSQGSQRNEEQRVVLRCVTGNHYTDRDVQQIKDPLLPLVPLGRHGTEFTTWLSMPLTNIESTSRQASRRRMRCSNKHQMDFESWSAPQVDPEVVNREMNIQRRRTFQDIDLWGSQRPVWSSPSYEDAATNTS